MPKSRYVSRKPAHQTHPKGSQPPIGSTAVFEWETFSPLPDYSDRSLAEVFKRISRDVIERPYHYDSHKAFDAKGNPVPYPFTQADNLNPPAKIPGVAVYKQNHGTGHALRQAMYTRALIDKIAEEGNPKGQDIAKKIQANPELKSALELAAYCKRIGRTFDHEHDDPGHPSVYSQRSADMFAKMAKELGYNDDLIKIIHDGMLEPTPKDPATLNSYKDVAGISGKDLRYFTENVLMSAHMADLTRIFKVKRNYIETSLKYYFEPAKLKEVSTQLVEMGCKANAMTGNPVAQQEPGVKHQPKSVDGKRLVEVVTHIDQTMDELAKLKLTTAAVKPANKVPVAPAVQGHPSPVVSSTPQAGLIPFQVDFGKVPKNDTQRQAREILNEVNRLHKLGAKTVGITYSANQDQTDKIIATYQSGQWKTGTTGSNQADVIKEIEKLLATEYQHLQTVYRTVPITTMKYVGGKAMAADDASVMKSLQNADQFIANGGVLLGWKNQFTPSGKLAIGGGVASKLQTAAQKQMIDNWIQKHPMPQHVAHVGHAASKWQKLKLEADAEPIKEVGYKPVNVGVIDLAEVEKHLKDGEVPLATDMSTMIDKYIHSDDATKKIQAADLLANYAVKQVMGDLHVPVQINMVDNNRAKVPGHDNHAMKVTFATQAEALAFSKKLFNEYGIHSFTFGPGTMKTPQNGSIFLTKDDLEKISLATKITHESGSGAHAYVAKADEFMQNKVDMQKDMDDTEVVQMTPRM